MDDEAVLVDQPGPDEPSSDRTPPCASRYPPERSCFRRATASARSPVAIVVSPQSADVSDSRTAPWGSRSSAPRTARMRGPVAGPARVGQAPRGARRRRSWSPGPLAPSGRASRASQPELPSAGAMYPSSEIDIFRTSVATRCSFPGWSTCRYRPRRLRDASVARRRRGAEEMDRARVSRSTREPCIHRTGATGLEPATSGVTGRRSNRLNYAPESARVAAHGRIVACSLERAARCPACLPLARAADALAIRGARPVEVGGVDRTCERRLHPGDDSSATAPRWDGMTSSWSSSSVARNRRLT